MEKQVIPTGDVVEAFASDYGDFGRCVAQLAGVEPAIGVFGAREVAQVRILTGKDSVFSRDGCWVGENFNYKNDEIVIAPRVVGVGKYNPIFTAPAEATRVHREGKEFYLDDKVWEN